LRAFYANAFAKALFDKSDEDSKAA